tara:strand:- start:1105 stop:1506 length:402 start_codon:yes stop_codon:yes gene_type:complete
MAGEVVLPIQECPDMICHTVTVCLSATGGDVVDDHYVFYCERDTIVDAATVMFVTNDADATLKLTTAATGTIASGTDMTSALAISGTAGTPVHFTMTETANLVPAGNWIGLEITNTSTAEQVTVQMRVRTRVR